MIDRGYRSSGVSNGIVIRGINVDAAPRATCRWRRRPTVATYVDNTALFGNFVLKDIDRVEVLQRPAEHAIRIRLTSGQRALHHEEARARRL